MAGVPWENNNRAAWVFYSPDVLNKFLNGNGEPYYKGWELEKAAAHAHKSGRRGHVEYVFKKVPRLPILLKAYKDQNDYLEKAEGNADEVVLELAAKAGITDADVLILRMACIFLKMRSQFMDIWKAQVPIVLIPNSGRVKRSRAMINTKDGVREASVVETPGFRAVSLNASAETRKHLGL
jgi:phage terminase small subunit